MKLSVRDLKKITTLLLDDLEAKRVEVELPDFLWDIVPTKRYKPYDEPTIGSGVMEENWQSLQAILDGRDAPIGYALVWLGTLLRAVGDHVP